MQPRVAPIKKRVRDNLRIEMSEGGSATMRQLHEKHVERRAERETEEVRQAKLSPCLSYCANQSEFCFLELPHGCRRLLRQSVMR
mmetsp:Transcript_15827/g.30926  ORF Transcript_15827/g.30926 Transcript_15827/m.30926 type:complete len:85 (+) Transcript_15827:1584-1838(+)